MEFSGSVPFGPSATLAAELPLRKPNDVKQVEPGSQPDNTASDAGHGGDTAAVAAAARDITALRREMEQRALPAGPPPTFELNQLEVETDIQKVIARVEAARAQAREADALQIEALKVEADAEERLDEAGTSRLAEIGPAWAPEPSGAATGAEPANAGPAGTDTRTPLDTLI